MLHPHGPLAPLFFFLLLALAATTVHAQPADIDRQPAVVLAALDDAARGQGATSTGEAADYGLACRAWLDLGKPERARSNCLSAIDANPTRSRWRDYNNLGVAEFRLGDLPAARNAFEQAALLAGMVYTPRKNLELVEDFAQAREVMNASSEALVVR